MCASVSNRYVTDTLPRFTSPVSDYGAEIFVGLREDASVPAVECHGPEEPDYVQPSQAVDYGPEFHDYETLSGDTLQSKC